MRQAGQAEREKTKVEKKGKGKRRGWKGDGEKRGTCQRVVVQVGKVASEQGARKELFGGVSVLRPCKRGSLAVLLPRSACEREVNGFLEGCTELLRGRVRWEVAYLRARCTKSYGGAPRDASREPRAASREPRDARRETRDARRETRDARRETRDARAEDNHLDGKKAL
jgi:hypothetical protein